MPIWLLIALGGGGYLAYEAFRQKYPEGITAPAAEAIFDQVKAVEETYDAGELSSDALEVRMEVISENQLTLREAAQMSMAEYNILQSYKVALLGKAGLL